MIDIQMEHAEGFGAAIRGMRNPLESWDKCDSGLQRCPHRPFPIGSVFKGGEVVWQSPSSNDVFTIGPNDKQLMMKLAKAGSEHAKYKRMIVVYMDIKAPLYWWKEFDTYKVGTVANSCSTMHCIHKKEFTADDFSCEHLGYYDADNDGDGIVEACPFKTVNTYPYDHLLDTIVILNYYRERYLKTKDKKYWWQMIQLLPSSYNQKRTVMLNYEVLTNIYRQRKDHKLDEWRKFCAYIKYLPLSQIITFEEPKPDICASM